MPVPDRFLIETPAVAAEMSKTALLSITPLELAMLPRAGEHKDARIDRGGAA